MIEAKALVEKFQQSLNEKWGYIYGMTHEMWSAEKQAAYKKQYSNDPDRENSCLYGGKWAGHWVTDCSGLFAWAFSQLGGRIAHGSNSIWNSYLTDKGVLLPGNEEEKWLYPGIAVFTTTGDKHNHIGLYVGNGMVIEAQGAQAGVVQSLITNKKWTAWGILKNVNYKTETGGGSGMTAKVVLASGDSGNTVNMRDKPSVNNSSVIRRVPVGVTVDVFSDLGQWMNIGYDGKSGWMLSNRLEYDGQPDDTGGDTITAAEREKIDNAQDVIDKQLGVARSALNEIEKQQEIVRSTLSGV